MKKAALYDPYLNTLGGGEKYILSILKILHEQGYEISLFWDKNLSQEIEKKFLLRCFDTAKYLPNIFKKTKSALSSIEILTTLKKFEYFFYVTDGSYFFSPAKHNYIYAMVPQKNLYNMNLVNRLKTANSQFICHSKFTQNHLKSWGVESRLLYPFISPDSTGQTINKEKIIISVGRFFKHLHSKRQDLSIKFFRELKIVNPLFNDFKLILAGGLNDEDKTYFDKIKKIAGNDTSIIFKPNISYRELISLYKKSLFYWHLAGYGIDDDKNPELVEHLGLTPLEAMAYQSIPFCFAAGGPKEIINNGINGFLFENKDELIKKMSTIVKDVNLQNQIKIAGIQYIKDNFSYDIFKKNAINLLNI